MYECLNDLGANVAAILDDNQMSYCNMDEYVRNSRIERYNMNAKNAKIDLTRILKRNSDEADLDAYWGAGIKMDV